MNKDRIETDAPVIGVVFPVHGIFRIPSIVERFVGKLEGIGLKYLFAVSTFGSMAGGAIKSFGEVVESHGGKLSAGFAVHMPMNNITLPSFMYRGTIGKKEEKLFADWQKKLDFVCEYVSARREGRFEATNRLLLSLFYPIDKIYGRGRLRANTENSQTQS